LTFPATGTFPNGELASYRLFGTPDVSPTTIMTPANGYWIVRNFGTNTSFTSLTGISMMPENINPAYIGSPSSLGIFKRAANAEGNTWASNLSTASSVSATAVNFGGLTNFTTFGQFSIGQVSVPSTVSALDLNELPISIFPNPSKDFINIQVCGNRDSKSEFTIYNNLGQTILQGNTVPETINVQHFDKGIYYLKTMGVSVKFVVE
jgi:hypothetical protein